MESIRQYIGGNAVRDRKGDVFIVREMRKNVTGVLVS